MTVWWESLSIIPKGVEFEASALFSRLGVAVILNEGPDDV